MLLAWTTPFLVGQQVAPAVEELRADGASRLDVRRGLSARLRVSLASRELLRFDFDPGDLRINLSVKSPEGKDLVRVEGISGSYGPLPVSVIADVAGVYDIIVEPIEDAAGLCIITFRERRAYLPHDDGRIAIQTSIFEAARLTKQGSADSLRAAVKLLMSASDEATADADVPHQALAVTLLGRLQILQAQFKIAEDTLPTAIELWKNLANRKAEAQAMAFLAEAQGNLGQTAQALQLHERTLAIRREVADRRGEADTLNGIGTVRFGRSDIPGALQAFEMASEIRRDLGDRTGLVMTLNNIAVVHNSVGETRAAIESYERALDLLASAPNQRVEVALRTNLGRAYWSLAQYQKALQYDQHALALAKGLADRRSEALLLNNLGVVHESLGDHERALGYYGQSLSIKRDLNDSRGEGITRSNIGMVRISLRQYRPALQEFEAALPLLRIAGDRVTEGNVLNNIGDCHLGLQDFEVAIDYFQQALALRMSTEDRPGQVYSLNSLGETYLRLKKYPEAEEQYGRALTLALEVGDRNTELGARYGIAQARAALGDLAKAYSLVESALEIVESSRTQVVLQDLRTSYFASHNDYYAFAVDVLMRLHVQQPSSGYAAKALALHERAQARSLADIIRESGADIRKGVPPELLARERTLRERLAASIDRRLRSLVGKAGGPTSPAITKEIDAISNELDSIEMEIRTKSPAYASLTQPAPLSATEIQRELGSGQTALLEYSLGTDRGYGWLVTPAFIKSFEIPARSEVENASRRFYDLVASRSAESASESPKTGASQTTEEERLAIRLGVMLFGPVAKELSGKRLVIIPDGILSYLPFDAIGEPNARNQYTPLLVGHVISTLPSASVLSAIRIGRGNRQPAPKLLAVIADPVFDRADPRVGAKANVGVAPALKADGATRDFSDTRASQMSVLGRLVYSRREAESISSVIPGALTLLDFGASLEAVTSPEMARFRIIHLATHGFLDSDHPDQSALVLSLVDDKGNPRQGFLPVADIFNLNLPAELVVLSACQTALGRDVRGEGLIGLTRAFMYAGATRVIASLWKVDDLATAELMKAFYQRLGTGANPVDALRAAQCEISKKSAWSSPYYWAGFVLQGEFEDSPVLRLHR